MRLEYLSESAPAGEIGFHFAQDVLLQLNRLNCVMPSTPTVQLIISALRSHRGTVTCNSSVKKGVEKGEKVREKGTEKGEEGTNGKFFLF